MALSPVAAALVVVGVVLAFGARSVLLVVWHRSGHGSGIRYPSPPSWVVLAVRVGGALCVLVGVMLSV